MDGKESTDFEMIRQAGSRISTKLSTPGKRVGMSHRTRRFCFAVLEGSGC